MINSAHAAHNAARNAAHAAAHDTADAAYAAARRPRVIFLSWRFRYGVVQLAKRLMRVDYGD
jgi:hypothetical protein